MRTMLAYSILATCGVTVSVLLWLAKPPPQRVSLSIPNSQLDLKNVWAQKGLRWPLHVYNHSDAAVIASLEASCACTEIAPRTVSIPPSAFAEIVLTLDLMPSVLQRAEQDESALQVYLFATTEGRGAARVSWALTGRVRRSLVFADYVVTFSEDDNVFAESRTISAKTIRFESPSRPLQRVVATPSSPDAIVSATLEDQGSGWLEIAPQDNIKDGVFYLTVDVRPQLDTGEWLPATQLQVNGTALSEVALLPESIDFGVVEVGSVQNATVTIAPRTTSPIARPEVEKVGVGMNVTYLGELIPGAHSYGISQVVTTTGVAADDCVFVVSDASGFGRRMPIRVTYFGKH